jgi:hypothetical protein
LRAERKAGDLLERMAIEGTRDRGRGGDRKSQSSDATVKPATLAELGISPDQSSKWQKLAKVPKAQFEAALREPEPATTIRVPRGVDGWLRMGDDSLWLWGQLRACPL